MGGPCQNLQLDPFRVLGCRVRSTEVGLPDSTEESLGCPSLVGQGPESKYETNNIPTCSWHSRSRRAVG